MLRKTVLFALAALTIGGCYQRHGESAPTDTVTLQIWARSDLPPRSVSRARIGIAGRDRSVALPDDGIPQEPILLLELPIETGEHRLDITLFSPTDVVVATQTTFVRVTTDQSVTVVFTAGCLGLECADDEVCQAGVCRNECELFPERCMPCECADDSDCPEFVGECGTVSCLACICAATPDNSLCPSGVCGDDFLCRNDPSPMCFCQSDAECGGPVAGTCFFEVCDCTCFPGEGMCETGTVCSPNEALCVMPQHRTDFLILGRVDRPDELRRYRVFIGEVLRFRGTISPSELREGLQLGGPELPTGTYDVRVELLDFSYLPIAERLSVVDVQAPTLLRVEFF